VVHFSGGADSACELVEAIALRREKPLVVSHRPSTYWIARQRDLTEAIRGKFPVWPLPYLGFRIHRKNSEPADSAQRSRAFLYASLGAAVASELHIPKILLADNGVVSLNLPISAQLTGALASRATHPKFIDLFNRFIAALAPEPLTLSNPLWSRTRAETLEILKTAGAEDLLQATVSCSRTRGQPAAKPHCGICYQCVNRRFASIAAGLEAHDAAARYGVDIFSESLREGEARTTAESFLRFARTVREWSPERLFLEFPQLDECIMDDDPSEHETAVQLAGVIQRHAAQVRDAMRKMYARFGGALADGTLPGDCLIALGVPRLPQAEAPPAADVNVFRKEGRKWRIAFRGTPAFADDAVGMAYIATLLRTPRQEVHVLNLESIQPTRGKRPALSNRGEVRRPSAEGLRLADAGNTGEIVGRQARREYQARLAELPSEVERAEKQKDHAQIAALEREAVFLSEALQSGIGLAGRPRNFRDAEEAARDAVGKAIRRSIAMIRREHEELGLHLHTSITISHFCVYLPDPLIPWEF
jgi:hypothetical protein